LPFEIDVEVGFDAPHHVKKVPHHQLLGPVLILVGNGVGHPGVKSEVVNWVLKKPSPEHRTAIEDCVARSVKALPDLLAGEMEKATMLIHTSKPLRPKPSRPATLPTQGDPA